jgi:hypothetical protein
MPVTLPPGRLRLSTRPAVIGSPPISKAIGIVEVARLAASAEGGAAGCGDHGHPSADQIGDQPWQQISVILSPAVFDSHVLALDITELVQTSTECGHAAE